MSFILFPSIPLVGPGTITGPLTIASGTITANAPGLTVNQTWNNAAVGFSAVRIEVTNLSSLYASSSPFEIVLGGITRIRADRDGYFIALGYLGGTRFSANYYSNGVRISSDSEIAWTNTVAASGTADVILLRDQPARLALRNGTAQQSFGVYNTESGSLANYERLTLTGVAGTSVNLTAESLGTGAANLNVVITTKGTGFVGINTPIPLWNLSVTGTTACELSLKDSTSNFVIGPIGGFAYLSTTTSVPIIFRPNSSEKMRVSPSGVISFGGVSNSVPAVKPSGIVLQVRLGDDSADAPLSALYVKTTAKTFASLTAAATAGAGARDCINNCSTAVFNAAADGAGALTVPVWSDGAAWKVG